MEQKAKTFIEENRNILIGGAVGLLVLAAGAWLWTSKSKPTPQVPAQLPQTLTFNEKFIKVVRQIQEELDKSQNKLSPQVLKAIYRGQYFLSNEKAQEIIKKGRSERRLKMKEKDEYAHLVIKYEQELEKAQEEHLGGILAHFNIDRQTWISETERWPLSSEEAGEEWNELVQLEEERLYDSLRDYRMKPKKFEEVEAILRFKIHNLEDLQEEELALNIEEESSKFLIVDSYIRDLVFKKFNVEEELLEYSVSKLTPAERAKLEALYDQIASLMEKFVYEGAEDDEEADLHLNPLQASDSESYY